MRQANSRELKRRLCLGCQGKAWPEREGEAICSTWTTPWLKGRVTILLDGEDVTNVCAAADAYLGIVLLWDPPDGDFDTRHLCGTCHRHPAMVIRSGEVQVKDRVNA